MGGSGTRGTARRAVPQPEMPEVPRRVDVLVPADDAVLGVHRSGRGRRADVGILNAEVGHVAADILRERGDERIVGVEQRGHAVDLCERAADDRRRLVEFAVPVELVSEQVCDDDVGRLQPRDRGRHRGLVDLEHRDVGVDPKAEAAARLHERRRHTTGEVRTALVGEHAHSARSEDLGEHLRGGRLAVGAGDDDDPARDGPGELGDDGGVDTLRDESRQRRPAAGTSDPRRQPSRLRGDDCDIGGKARHGPSESAFLGRMTEVTRPRRV